MALSPLSGPDPLASQVPDRQISPTTSPISPTRKPKPNSKSDSPTSSRLPPPSLFQGPPSRNASNLSLHVFPGASAAAIGLPSLVSGSASTAGPPISSVAPDKLAKIASRNPPSLKSNSDNSPKSPSPSAAAAAPASSTLLSPNGRSFHRQTQPGDANAKREKDRANALWAEMQSALAEVELSAANGSHIFGKGHADALQELRMAQLELAKGWAKSEREDVAGQGEGGGDRDEGPEKEKEKDGRNGGGKPGLGGDANEGQTEKERRKTLEEETENDIRLARTRREANDRYFEQVHHAVGDVVKKLDEVAGAMRKVEKESRDIWSEDEDEDGTESISGSTTGAS